MPKKASNTPSSVVAWWLTEGDEECPHCGGLYFYEVEFRCTDCDGPGCPHCKAVHAAGHLVCPNCISSEVAQKQVNHG